MATGRRAVSVSGTYACPLPGTLGLPPKDSKNTLLFSICGANPPCSRPTKPYFDSSVFRNNSFEGIYRLALFVPGRLADSPVPKPHIQPTRQSTHPAPSAPSPPNFPFPVISGSIVAIGISFYRRDWKVGPCFFCMHCLLRIPDDQPITLPTPPSPPTVFSSPNSKVSLLSDPQALPPPDPTPNFQKTNSALPTTPKPPQLRFGIREWGIGRPDRPLSRQSECFAFPVSTRQFPIHKPKKKIFLSTSTCDARHGCVDPVAATRVYAEGPREPSVTPPRPEPSSTEISTCKHCHVKNRSPQLPFREALPGTDANIANRVGFACCSTNMAYSDMVAALSTSAQARMQNRWGP